MTTNNIENNTNNIRIIFEKNFNQIKNKDKLKNILAMYVLTITYKNTIKNIYRKDKTIKSLEEQMKIFQENFIEFCDYLHQNISEIIIHQYEKSVLTPSHEFFKNALNRNTKSKLNTTIKKDNNYDKSTIAMLRAEYNHIKKKINDKELRTNLITIYERNISSKLKEYEFKENLKEQNSYSNQNNKKYTYLNYEEYFRNCKDYDHLRKNANKKDLNIVGKMIELIDKKLHNRNRIHAAS